MQTFVRRPILLVLLFALVLALAGCGSDDKSSSSDGSSSSSKTSSTGGASDGKSLFSNKCSGCHTLSDAGATGSAGPNLDDLKPDADTVRAQIENGGGGMPSGLVEGDDADAVADYVSSAAGK